jgi:hypothetical protein
VNGVRLSGGLFLLSLALPAFHFANHPPVFGLEVLLMGWWGLFTFNLGWLANPFYICAMTLVLCRLSRLAIVPGCLAIPLALHSLAVKKYFFNEAYSTPIRSLGLAFYVWLAAMIVLAVTLMLQRSPARVSHSA